MNPKPSKMTLKDFKQSYEIDCKTGRAFPKGVAEGKIHKYRAVSDTREIDGKEVKFPSKKEAKTYDKLALMERAGRITELKVNAGLKPKIKYIFQTEPFNYWYEPDFEYLENGIKVVADAKGIRTAEYKRKKRLMKEMFDIEIVEY